MALGLTAEHLALAESVHGWASRHCPPELVRAVVDGPGPGADLGRAWPRRVCSACTWPRNTAARDTG